MIVAWVSTKTGENTIYGLLAISSTLFCMIRPMSSAIVDGVPPALSKKPLKSTTAQYALSV